MRIIGIIPARMGSSRFPGKPLAKILGIPMIGHVYERSKKSNFLNEIYVATCDHEIAEYVRSIDGKVIMTKDTHERASDRTAEAMLKIEEMTRTKIDIVVMIQGDEPMLEAEMIDLAIQPLLGDPSISVVNLMSKIKEQEDQDDPNEVKVVVDKFNNAIYFSREAIPSRHKGAKNIQYLKQICIIPFRRDFLLHFNDMPQTPLEIIESVDMMRLIENDLKVHMVYCNNDTYSVDTLEDLKWVEQQMKSQNKK